MKKPFFILVYMFFIIVVLPVLLTIGIYRNYIFEDKPVVHKEHIKSTNIKVYNARADKVETMNLEEYLYNVVASEMPATFEEEALKAQAIAARSYVFNKIENGGENIPQHKGAVVCTDHNHCQEYLSLSELQKYHNKDWVNNLWPKIKKCVNETKGMVLVYDGKTIQPLYHSTSGGRTENSEEVFASKLPYLRSVDSPYEQGSPKLVANMKMTKKDFIDKIKASLGINLSQDLNKDVHILDRTEGGSVKEIRLVDTIVKGRQIRAALNLNSSDFEIKFNGNEVNIITKGYGHGVGMSQWGANGMAGKGYHYDEILKHYFKGVEIKNKYKKAF